MKACFYFFFTVPFEKYLLQSKDLPQTVQLAVLRMS